MVKRKSPEDNFNPKKRKFIDIIYSEFDSDPDSEEDPEWLPEKKIGEESEETEESGESEESSSESEETEEAEESEESSFESFIRLQNQRNLWYFLQNIIM